MVEQSAIVPADAVNGGKPQSSLTVFMNREHPITAKSVLLGKRLELVPVKATGAVVRCGNPDKTLAVFGDMFDADPGQAIGYGISPPGTRAVE